MTAPLFQTLRRLTASTTAGGVMMVGLPLALEYVVRPGDTLSEIAGRHGTSVSAIVQRNGLPRSGDHIVAGRTLTIPAAHGRSAAKTRSPKTRAPRRVVDPDARRIVRYRVRPGDTPSGLAVRFRAWTAEVIARNGPVLRIGEVVEIPVVLAALERGRRTGDSRPARPRHQPKHTTQHQRKAHARPARRQAGPSRHEVRRVIEATARRHGVDPNLALAVSWQEAGWQMHHVSYAHAIGAMQVIPATGRWMSDLVGRRLHLRDTRDNVTAGVVLLKVLLDQAPRRRAIAGYYQGLAGVRAHGMYPDTRRYVANVLALRHRFARGDYPA